MLANTFSLMVKDKKLTPGMASKCGNSGLALRHLKLAYQREGDEGVKSLLQEKDENNKPRVTARRDIINSICQWLESDKQIRIVTSFTKRTLNLSVLCI